MHLYFTAKQFELMRIIGERNPDGTATDLDQILERLSYETSKQSLQFSIRALLNRDLIKKDGREKRRGRFRVVISLTELGEKLQGRGKSEPAMVVDPETEAFLEEFSDLLSE